jgi:hypothetical protein
MMKRSLKPQMSLTEQIASPDSPIERRKAFELENAPVLTSPKEKVKTPDFPKIVLRDNTRLPLNPAEAASRIKQVQWAIQESNRIYPKRVSQSGLPSVKRDDPARIRDFAMREKIPG